MGFDWPRGKVWGGFLNPHYRKCSCCGGSGSTESKKALRHLVHLLMISGDDSRRMSAFPHPWLVRAGIDDVGTTMHELTVGLAGRDLKHAHDAIDNQSAVDKIIAAAGLPDTWGTCAACDGEGLDPSVREAYEAWTETPVPTGDGWQMWETTSEGSPISPVFATPEELARWLADNGASTFGNNTATYDQWLAMVQSGWAMSAMFVPGKGVISGVEAVADMCKNGIDPVDPTPVAM